MNHNNSERFAIDAASCTLFNPNPSKALIGHREYVVPVYQRPYAWGEKETRRMMSLILESYRNHEPAFIGTVQLMPRPNGAYDVVDGQQRLTTLALLLRLLKLRGLSIPVQHNSWLATKVSKDEQQLLFAQALGMSLEETRLLAASGVDSQNRYMNNLAVMNSMLDEESTREIGDGGIGIGQEFIDYLGTSLYSVVIETKAGLAKTLEIFNTINTAGMDLNGGDLFKIRMFEYMTRIQGNSEDSSFERIDALYAQVDEINRKDGYGVTSMPEIINIYRHYLIGRYSGNTALHGLGADSFYERLFAVLLNNSKDALIPAGKFHLELDDVIRFAAVSLEYERHAYNSWYYMLWRTRYGSYWYLDCLYVYRFGQGDYVERLQKFTEKLFRLLAVPSLIYGRSVYRTHGDMHRLMSVIADPNSTEIRCARLDD